jgi:dTDP-4-amino-4,6-dideoxygalactose transaminase
MVLISPDAPIGRDELMQSLLDQNISTRRGIMAIHREEPYRNGDWDRRLPVTNEITDTGMILPLYQDMTDVEQEFVMGCIEYLSAVAHRR